MSTNKKRFGFSWGNQQKGPTYTPAERKGEVNELRTLLRDPAVEKDATKRREVIKKVLAFMTLGLDTSPLFTEMVLACATKDLVQKKMVYFYLCVHSEANSELAILAINTLQKNCRDESPLVRGLALRSLASLRLPQIAEYLVPTLKEALVDKAPYVRKTAILAILNLFRVAPESFRTMGLVDRLYGMMRDNDALVCTNAIAVLQEVLEDEGGIQLNKAMLYYLLNRLRDMTEWQQCLTIELVTKYSPSSEEEMFEIMNLLEERLLGSNSAVIVACSHVLLYLTQNLPTVHKQVFERLVEPLLTLMATAHSHEASYTVLCHIRLLVQREPRSFAAKYKDFYCRYNDPSYIKCVKIGILTTIASESNASDIVAELVEYVSDGNSAISKQSINAMAAVSLHVEACSPQTLGHFLELLAMDVEHVRGQTLVAMKDYLRKYTSIDIVRPFLDQIVKSYKDLAFQDDDSKIALVWVLGEFGEHIEDSPYLVEGMAQLFGSEGFALRIEILTTLMKLFFKRPPEVQPVLARVLALAINDFSHADVHDRALLYYRLLRTNPRAAAQVVCAPRIPVTSFAEDDIADERDKLFEEFNTASVILGMPSSQYLRAVDVDSDDDEEEEEGEEEEEEGEEEEVGLLSTPPQQEGLQLDEDAELEQAAFQSKWGTFSVALSTAVKFKGAPAAEVLEAAFEEKSVFTLAKGQQGTLLKMYLYAESTDPAGVLYLVELQIQATGTANVTIKTSPGSHARPFIKLFNATVAPFVAA